MYNLWDFQPNSESQLCTHSQTSLTSMDTEWALNPLQFSQQEMKVST